MALPTTYNIGKSRNTLGEYGLIENGGKGSGNFGHSGRPGKVGGSGSGMGSSESRSTDEIRARMSELRLPSDRREDVEIFLKRAEKGDFDETDLRIAKRSLESVAQRSNDDFTKKALRTLQDDLEKFGTETADKSSEKVDWDKVGKTIREEYKGVRPYKIGLSYIIETGEGIFTFSDKPSARAWDSGAQAALSEKTMKRVEIRYFDTDGRYYAVYKDTDVSLPGTKGYKRETTAREILRGFEYIQKRAKDLSSQG